MNRFFKLISYSVLLLNLTADRIQADGNVTVQVKNGNLQVTGQNNITQCLLVVPTGVPWQFELSNPPTDTGAPTLFNGQTTLTVSGVTGDMKFDLKSGRKMLILSNSKIGGAATNPIFLIRGNLKISASGSSSAIIILNKVFTESTEITTKNGSDAVLLMNCRLAGNAKINTGGGNDVLLVDGDDSIFALIQRCEINLGSGNDHLLVNSAVVLEKLTINLGSGNDQAGILYSDLGITSINGGGGFDQFAETASNFLTFSSRSVEDQTTLDVLAIYLNAFDSNAAFNFAHYIYYTLLGT